MSLVGREFRWQWVQVSLHETYSPTDSNEIWGCRGISSTYVAVYVASFHFNFLGQILKETTIKRHCTRDRVHDGKWWPMNGANVEIFSKFLCMTSYILDSWNPLTSSRHVSSLTMSNFDAYMYILKKFQCWPHSLLTMWGWCMTFVVVELEVPWHFKRVPTQILQMETTKFEKYEMPHYERCWKHGRSQRLCG